MRNFMPAIRSQHVCTTLRASSVLDRSGVLNTSNIVLVCTWALDRLVEVRESFEGLLQAKEPALRVETSGHMQS